MSEPLLSPVVPPAPVKDERGTYLVYEEMDISKLAAAYTDGKVDPKTQVLVLRSERTADKREDAITDFVGEEDKAGRWKEGTPYRTLAKRYVFLKAPKRQTTYV